MRVRRRDERQCVASMDLVSVGALRVRVLCHQQVARAASVPRAAHRVWFDGRMRSKRCKCCRMEGALLALRRRSKNEPVVMACPDCDALPLSLFVRAVAKPVEERRPLFGGDPET